MLSPWVYKGTAAVMFRAVSRLMAVRIPLDSAAAVLLHLWPARSAYALRRRHGPQLCRFPPITLTSPAAVPTRRGFLFEVRTSSALVFSHFRGAFIGAPPHGASTYAAPTTAHERAAPELRQDGISLHEVHVPALRRQRIYRLLNGADGRTAAECLNCGRSSTFEQSMLPEPTETAEQAAPAHSRRCGGTDRPIIEAAACAPRAAGDMAPNYVATSHPPR
jgi:hypothetical protein